MKSILKLIALIIPTITSVIVFIVVLIGQKIDIISLYPSDNLLANSIQLVDYKVMSEYVDGKINLGLSILGIAVTLWMGLNIYNVIEKNQVEKMELKIKELEGVIDEFNKKIDELNVSLNETEEKIKNGVVGKFG